MDYSKLIFQIGNLKFHTVNISKGSLSSSIPSHVHSLGSYEIHYISEGVGKLIANGKTFHLSKGMLYLTGPGLYHEQIIMKENPMSEICINFIIDTLATVKSTLISTSFFSHTFWIGNDTQNLMTTLHELFYETERNEIGGNLIIISYLTQLVVKLVRNYEENNLLAAPPLENTFDTIRFLQIERIFLNEFNTITLADLSKRIGLSERQTERLLRTYYHSTFQKKKLESRMATAKHLLVNTDKKIYEIAEITGYSTPEHFCNVFKNYYHVSAKELRKLSLKVF